MNWKRSLSNMWLTLLKGVFLHKSCTMPNQRVTCQVMAKDGYTEHFSFIISKTAKITVYFGFKILHY